MSQYQNTFVIIVEKSEQTRVSQYKHEVSKHAYFIYKASHCVICKDLLFSTIHSHCFKMALYTYI